VTAVEAESSVLPPHRLRPVAIGAIAVIACVVVRLVYLLSGRDRFNGDEGTTGIMVQRMLHGHFYIFYAGQNYGGTIEQYLATAMYFVFRLPQDRFTLRLPELVLTGVTTALVYAVGRRALPTPAHAVIAALLFAAGPWYNVQDVMAMGFYTVSQTLAIAGVYVAIRVNDDPNRGRWALLFGLMAGLAYWNALIAAYALVPAGLWLVPVLRRRPRLIPLVLAGAVVGAAPLLPWMIRTGHLVPLPARPVKISLLARLHNLGGPVLREFTGLGITDGAPQPGIALIVVEIVLVLLLVGWLVLVWTRRRGFAALVRLESAQRQPLEMVIMAVPITVGLYLTSTSAVWTVDPKYLLSAYPMWVILLAAMIPFRRGVGLIAMALVLIGATSGLTIRYFAHTPWQVSDRDTAGQSTLPNSRERDAGLKQAIRYCVAHGDVALYSDYWTAMPMQYLAHSRLTVATLYGYERFPVLPVLRAAPAIAYVVDTTDPSTTSVIAALASHHVTFTVHKFGPRIEIVDDIGPGGRPQDLDLGS
jgi:hypothetical protein